MLVLLVHERMKFDTKNPLRVSSFLDALVHPDHLAVLLGA
jgi:hypothetical protein